MLGVKRLSLQMLVFIVCVCWFMTSLLLLSDLSLPTGLKSWTRHPAPATPTSKALYSDKSSFYTYGEMGKPVILPSNITQEVKKLVDEGWQKNVFNQYVSDLISLHRTLPDPRNAWCKRQNYSTELPQTSVIICFHNEAWSTLLRTLHSVINRSPSNLIKEIILVDDYSDMPHLKWQLDKYMDMYPKVKIVRATQREGLIRARLLGARHATAPVLTYLDSHCECTKGWLEPLLDRIHRDETTVVCPDIDVIDDKTMEYHWVNSSNLEIGGFNWNLEFTWIAVLDREKKKHKDPAEPIHVPTMAGGLFSISADFFQKLGTYDSGFEIWGGENLELSFKTWMCGGTLEMVPCSRVGHIFRKHSPYKWKSGALKRNLVRLAKVWMDEFAKYYYQRIGNDLGDFGDIEPRIQLRKRLRCKSFKWYLDNVYPELFRPGDAVASGEIRNEAYGLCIDSNNEDLYKPIGLWPCEKLGGNQYWLLSKNGEIRRDEACLDYSGGDVVLYPCHGLKENQLWSYIPETNLIQHGSWKKCMGISSNKQNITMEDCNSKLAHQRWKFENYNASKAMDAASESPNHSPVPIKK